MTESERDMTRLAALAAGYAVYEEDGEFFHHNPTVRECGGWRLTWAPGENDGDSRRLEVRVGITVHRAQNYVVAIKEFGFMRDYVTCHEDHGDDPAAATRRAVLRAAAEIAKAQQREELQKGSISD